VSTQFGRSHINEVRESSHTRNYATFKTETGCIEQPVW